jgi:hypothetical protein
MKKLILPILLLIITSSFCFGTSIKMILNTTKNKDVFKTHITFISDKKLPLGLKKRDGSGINYNRFTISFKNINEENPIMPFCIKSKDNRRELETLRFAIKEILSAEWDKFDSSIFEAPIIVPFMLGTKIEELFIQNGFQLTFRDVIDDDKELTYTSDRFFYKTDK